MQNYCYLLRNVLRQIFVRIYFDDPLVNLLFIKSPIKFECKIQIAIQQSEKEERRVCLLPPIQFSRFVVRVRTSDVSL